MKTKHLISSMIALMAILMVSCADKQSAAGIGADGERTFAFNVSTDAQAQTRAGVPAVSGYKLNYVMQVVDAKGIPVSGTEQNNLTGSFTVTLPVGATYTCLFWADFIPDGGSAATDNEYFTTTDLKAVALKKALTGEDQCQAFCGTASIAADQASATTGVTLKRAVAQVNLRSTEEMKGYSKLVAKYTNVPNTFNVLDNTTSVNGVTGADPDFTIADFTGATGMTSFTFQSVYFLAPGTESANMVEIELKTYNSASPATPLETLTIANVPTKKNYKTNVIGTFKPATVTNNYTIAFEEWGGDIAYNEVWDGVTPKADADATFSGGKGTVDDPYIIGKAADLAQLAANVNAGTLYDGKYFELSADINLAGRDWTPIGVDDTFNNPFKGQFDGKHHKITGLKISDNNSKLIGLFGYTEGKISNLHVNGNITATKQYAYAGGICGYGNEFTGCSFEGSVSSTNGKAGGICAAGDVYIMGCVNRGTITGSEAGGIVAYYQYEILACYNEGRVSGTNKAGGVVATLSGATSQIKDCYNVGEVINNGGLATVGSLLAELGSPEKPSACYVKEDSNPQTGITVFGPDTAWPTWKAGESADGTGTNGYWKSLGGWNDGSPVYPKLWWEE